MLSELEVLQDVCARLERAGIDYMLTGSMAMNVYAQPRMTRDIDMVVESGSMRADQLVALFSDAYYVSEEAVRDAMVRRSMFNLIQTESVVKIDFVIRNPEPYRLLEFQRRVRTQVDHFDAWVVSKEDLILSKLLWSAQSRSEMQARDIRNLLQTGFDETYLQEWAGKLGVSKRLEELRA
jgi:hypothetical protein